MPAAITLTITDRIAIQFSMPKFTRGGRPVSKKKLTPKQAAFVREYLVDLNAAGAARRAGYSPTIARRIGYANLNHPVIAAAIAEAQAERAERLRIEQDDVLRRLWAIATANPSELSRVRVSACRYCHGVDHQYHWTTRAEYEAARATWEQNREHAEEAGEPAPAEPSDAGGYGYALGLRPASTCPVCLGDGKTDVILADTHYVSQEAQTLFAGARATQAGYVIDMHDQMKALELVGKHLGMWRDLNLNLDLDRLSDEQLERIANGEDPLTVARTPDP